MEFTPIFIGVNGVSKDFWTLDTVPGWDALGFASWVSITFGHCTTAIYLRYRLVLRFRDGRGFAALGFSCPGLMSGRRRRVAHTPNARAAGGGVAAGG